MVSAEEQKATQSFPLSETLLHKTLWPSPVDMELHAEILLEGSHHEYCLEVWNDCLCAGSADHTIKVWNKKGVCAQVLKGHSGVVVCLTVWKNYLCSGSYDTTIRLWNADWNCVRILRGYSFGVIKLLGWKNHLFSRSTAWNTKGECVPILKEPTGLVCCLAVWNEFLCSGSSNGTISIWTESGDCVKTLEGHSETVNCLTVWKNLLCSASNDCTVRVWNSGWKCVRIQGHSYGVRSMTVWNNFLFLGDNEGTITVWTWTEKTHVAIIREHSAVVTDMKVKKNALYSTSFGVIKFSNLSKLSAPKPNRNSREIVIFDKCYTQPSQFSLQFSKSVSTLREQICRRVCSPLFSPTQ